MEDEPTLNNRFGALDKRGIFSNLIVSCIKLPPSISVPDGEFVAIILFDSAICPFWSTSITFVEKMVQFGQYCRKGLKIF